jgi:hypothetical protein
MWNFVGRFAIVTAAPGSGFVGQMSSHTEFTLSGLMSNTHSHGVLDIFGINQCMHSVRDLGLTMCTGTLRIQYVAT